MTAVIRSVALRLFIWLSASMLFLPQRVSAQCNIINTRIGTFFGHGMFMTKTLSRPEFCVPTHIHGDVGCGPTVALHVSMFSAFQVPPYVGHPSCMWDCPFCPEDARHITINSSDGLPVELLDFTVK